MNALAQMIERLGKLQIAELQRDVLERAADRLHAAVRDNLSTTPGDAHAMPWLRTGGLSESITSSIEESRVVVGSTSTVAVAQEAGTATVPSRPFLAPAAFRLAEAIAEDVGVAFSALLHGETPE